MNSPAKPMRSSTQLMGALTMFVFATLRPWSSRSPSAGSSRSGESTSVPSGGSPSQPGRISLSKLKSQRLVLPGSTASSSRARERLCRKSASVATFAKRSRRGSIILSQKGWHTERDKALSSAGNSSKPFVGNVVAADIASKTGLEYYPAAAGDPISGTYRQRLNLASGRFAMIEDGLGFSLVPWKPALDRHIGKQVSGLAQAETVDWNFGRKRTLGIN